MENGEQQSVGQTKNCLYCGEEIKIEAIKCKHCKSLLSGNITNNNQPVATANNNYTYKGLGCPKCYSNNTVSKRGCLIWFFAILFFPIGLLLLLIPTRNHCKDCGFTWK